MSPLLCLRPFRPITPTIDDWPAPRGQQQQQQPRVLRYGVLPFDFSAPVQPGLTFPKDFRAYHCPPDQIALTENFALPPPYPLRESSSNPVLFSDSVLGADVAEAFGYTVSSKNGNYTGIGDIGQARQRLPYDVHDDDLMAWRTRLETGADSGDGVVKANGSMIDTWPPWNFRFDLEL